MIAKRIFISRYGSLSTITFIVIRNISNLNCSFENVLCAIGARTVVKILRFRGKRINRTLRDERADVAWGEADDCENKKNQVRRRNVCFKAILSKVAVRLFVSSEAWIVGTRTAKGTNDTNPNEKAPCRVLSTRFEEASSLMSVGMDVGQVLFDRCSKFRNCVNKSG